MRTPLTHSNMQPQHIYSLTPLQRQQLAFGWALNTFGREETFNAEQRALRFFEEACELARAAGMSPEQMRDAIAYEFGRPAGEFHQELGGVILSASILAEAVQPGVDFAKAGADELLRVLKKPREHFRERNAAKNAAGFIATAFKDQLQPRPANE